MSREIEEVEAIIYKKLGLIELYNEGNLVEAAENNIMQNNSKQRRKKEEHKGWIIERPKVLRLLH